MSTETSELNQPNDGSEPRRRFGFLHADTGVDEDGVDRGAVTTDIDDEDDVTGDTAVYDSAGDPDVVDEDAADPQPTFTPSDGQPEATTLDDTTVDDTTTVPANVPVSAAVPASAAPVSRTGVFADNAPLLGDAVGLRASWQQAAAEFVDDPRGAVADAAELVEHTAQTLIGALQQRQRQLRGQWENRTATGVNGSDASVGEASGTVDTEELRHLMQSYRALFNQLTNS
jgi:hypothetical protein